MPHLQRNEAGNVKPVIRLRLLGASALLVFAAVSADAFVPHLADKYSDISFAFCIAHFTSIDTQLIT